MNKTKFWCLLMFIWEIQVIAGEFTNLDLDTHVEKLNGHVSGTYDLPGWNINNTLSQYEGYVLDASPDALAAILNDTFYSSSPKSGNYGLCLQPMYLTGPPYGRAEITLIQLGTVPEEAQSLNFKWYWGSFDVLVNGQPMLQYWNNYSGDSIWWSDGPTRISSGVDAWVDIHEYAGNEVELSFLTRSTIGSGWGIPLTYNLLDDIQFSNQSINDIMGPNTLTVIPSIPEPSTIVLGLLGGIAVWAYRRRK